jgi:hypothetical protein
MVNRVVTDKLSVEEGKAMPLQISSSLLCCRSSGMHYLSVLVFVSSLRF